MLWLVGLTSCGHITVYDREVCGDLGAAGAHCAHTLTDKKRDISKLAWDRQRVGMLCMSSQAYTDAETAIDQFCNIYPVCDFKTREELRAALARVKHVIWKAETKQGDAYEQESD